MSVSVVMVSYNTRELTLRSLRRLCGPSTTTVGEIIVVDNASHDGSAVAIRAAFPHVTLLELAGNVGFAAACNLGVRRSADEHVLLLNPDTEVQPGCIEALLDLDARRADAGVIGGRTFDEHGALDPHSCWGQPSLWSMLCFALGLSTVFAESRTFDPESLGSWARDDEREVGVVTGCLLLCRREVWNKLGGMDDTYFVYGEDVDFSFRARAAGYRPMITPHARLMHVRGASSSASSRKWQMLLRGKVTFMRKRWGPVRGRLGVTLLVIGTWLRATAARAGVPVGGPWKENWTDREQWLAGWEVHPPVPLRLVSGDDENAVNGQG